ncbi:MAG TPA: hypothetical protein VH092_37365, partial [Urbifossiella sp.]|nr:hypothetical protein [Urbifossiella sp.]
MPLLQVACPGCQAPLKAPDTMAGKKARCRKCNTPFRIPGAAPAADSAGDSQMLSVADPAARPAPPVQEEDIPSALPVEDEPLPAVMIEDDPPPAAGDLFAFTEAPAEPAAKKPRRPRDQDDTDRSPPPAAPPPAAGDPFTFTDAPTGPADKKKRRPRDQDDADRADDRRSPSPAAPPPAAGDPFSFADAPAGPADKKIRPPRDEGDDDRADDRRDRRPADRKKPAGGGGGLGKVVVAAAVFAVVVGGIVAGVLVFLNKPAEQAKNEKKDDKKPDAPAADPTPAPPPSGKADPTSTGKDKDAKVAKGGSPPKGAKGKGGKGGGMLALPPGQVLAFPARPAAPKKVTDPSSNPVPVAVPFAEVRRLFPPPKAEADIGVAWRSYAGFQGSGEKITLSLFSPNSGKEVVKVEGDGDGTPDPACDLSADGGTFALGNRTTGKVTVWDVRKKQKKLDAFDPYADKPEHKSAKLAAVYLTEPPDRLVTVTTAGAVHVWEVGTKAAAGEYLPPKAAAGKVAPGRGVAAFPNRQGVVVAVGGVIYKVDTAGAVAGSPAEDLGGDVGRSLALAVSPGGKLLYAFETDADGKKEKAVM